MKNRRGFTLIELVAVLGIMGIVLLMIFSPIISSFKNFGVQNKRVNIISDARASMDYITRQIRKSNDVNIVDNKITIGSSIYKVENKILFKDDKEVMKGIDELIINRVGETIKIEIIIKDSGGKDYRLSSIINIR